MAIGRKRRCLRSTNIHGFSSPCSSGVSAIRSTMGVSAALSKYQAATGESAAVTAAITTPRSASTRKAAPRNRGSLPRADCTTAWSMPR